ncbi:MAG: class A beta-lactamase-related serine hydrolase [Candidatus Omnitrophica bacterium]|nr:class A beta-lactamase-related serine hydrolase [Candidatus Omnitrophota bacterium]
MAKKILFLCLILALSILIYFSSWEAKKQRSSWSALEAEIKRELNGFNGQAGIIVKDLKRGREILINQDELFPSASLVKIPIMAACFYAAQEGKIKLDETVQLKPSHKSSGSGILKNMPVGARFTIERLIEIMICESDNTATNILIERLGFDYLNSCFKNLGLRDTNITRKMMDFKSRKEGRENFTTVSDSVFLLERIYNEKLIRRTYSRACLEFLKKQKIRDRIPAKLPQYLVVAHKTGLEYGVCHDVGIVFTPRGDFLIGVLTSHTHKTAKLAKAFIAEVAFLAYNYYQSF